MSKNTHSPVAEDIAPDVEKGTVDISSEASETRKVSNFVLRASVAVRKLL